ncbi:MAG: MFS transporter [Alphaproteobacteria bacterium]|nr:MFS transporter [Alphaproteobacteria bacterium]
MPDRVALPRLTLLAYGAPALPAAMLGLPLLVHLPTFYAQELGLGLSVVGFVMLAARIWDVATDPLVGMLSDRTRTRFGRRRPWLVAALPLVLAGVWFLFRPPVEAGAAHLLAWILVVYLGWTMLQVPHQAWGAELSDDYAERARIAATREGFGLAGVVVAVLLPAALPILGLVEPSRGVAAGLCALAVVTAIALPITGAAMLALVPEPAPRPRPPRSPGAGWALLRANRPFRLLLAAWFLNGIANGLPSTLFLLFVAHHLRLEVQQGAFLLAYFLAGLAGVPLALVAARRWGKHRAWCLAMLVTCAAFAAAPLLPAGAALGFGAICLVTGLGLGADLALPPAIQADVVDEDTAAGGEGRAGLYFALWGMATKLALALAVGIAFPLLDLAGFAPGGPATEPARLALAALYAWVPVALKLGAIALMWRFPLDAARQAALAQVIRSASRREQGPCAT